MKKTALTANQARLLTIAQVCFVVGAVFALVIGMVLPWPIDWAGTPTGITFVGLLIGLFWTSQAGTRPGLRLLVGGCAALLGWGYEALLIGIVTPLPVIHL